MAERKIIIEGNEILRKISKPVTSFGESLWDLLDDMKQTLVKAQGVGLAAPQVATLKRVFIVMVNNCYLEVVNPTIVKTSGTQNGPEGCLSVPNRQENITRPNKVTIDFFDRYANPMSITVEGFFARALCHEYGHLEGKLYIDFVDSKKANI